MNDKKRIGLDIDEVLLTDLYAMCKELDIKLSYLIRSLLRSEIKKYKNNGDL